MNRLTSVPTNIAPIIAMESGFCSSEPMSNENSSGTIAKMVVSDVMMEHSPFQKQREAEKGAFNYFWCK